MHSLMRSSQHYPKPQSNEVVRTVALMGTFVTVHVVGDMAGHKGETERTERELAVERALDWFYKIEECCTRFEASSEVMQLATQVGVRVPVSTILFEAVQFALAVAEATEGAFDPTVGYAIGIARFQSRIPHRSNDPNCSRFQWLCQLSGCSPRCGTPDDHLASSADS